jgi:hypothetical protein
MLGREGFVVMLLRLLLPLLRLLLFGSPNNPQLQAARKNATKA